jgi:amidohydrolase
VEGGRPGKTVALRADIDALPIQEENDHSFVSKVDGVMHACGHDAHTAMLVGAGWLLNDVREELPGRVLLVFKPAEEASPTGGARRMMKDGVFKEHRPHVIFAQHVWPELPVGRVGVRQCAMTGASDRFIVTIEGQGPSKRAQCRTNRFMVPLNQAAMEKIRLSNGWSVWSRRRERRPGVDWCRSVSRRPCIPYT